MTSSAAAAGADPITVFADWRWPRNISIGKIQERYRTRLPPHFTLVDLKVRGRIGAPLSPLAISRALAAARGSERGVFFSAGFVPPLWSPVPTVLVVHDLVHRRFHGPSQRLYFDVLMRPLYRRAAAIVCVSEYTRQEFLAWTGMDPARVHLVYNGGPEGLTPDGPRHEPGYPYIFYCGNRRHHKNLHRMVEAFCRSRLPRDGVHFLLTHGSNPELIEIARRHSQEDKLVFTGFLSEAELHARFRGTQAIAYASLFEGFGLPILEGYAAGVPVLTSTAAAMPEVAGGAALLVDPYSTDEIAAGMERIISDQALRRELVEKGRRRLHDFDWDRASDRIWQIVESAAA